MVGPVVPTPLLDRVRVATRTLHYSRRTERGLSLTPRGQRARQRVDAEPGSVLPRVPVRARAGLGV